MHDPIFERSAAGTAGSKNESDGGCVFGIIYGFVVWALVIGVVMYFTKPEKQKSSTMPTTTQSLTQ